MSAQLSQRGIGAKGQRGAPSNTCRPDETSPIMTNICALSALRSCCLLLSATLTTHDHQLNPRTLVEEFKPVGQSLSWNQTSLGGRNRTILGTSGLSRLVLPLHKFPKGDAQCRTERTTDELWWTLPDLRRLPGFQRSSRLLPLQPHQIASPPTSATPETNVSVSRHPLVCGPQLAANTCDSVLLDTNRNLFGRTRTSKVTSHHLATLPWLGD